MDFDCILNRRLTDSETNFVVETCRSIQTILRKWHKLYPDLSFKAIKLCFLNNSKSFEVQPEHKEELLSDCQLVESLRSKKEELGNRSLDAAVLENFSDLAHKFANKWNNFENHGITVHDLIQEGYMKIYDALYNWNPDKTAKLFTYLYSTLNHHMKDVIHYQGFALSQINTEGLEILKQFRAFRKNHKDIDDSVVISMMDLNQEKKEHLKKALACIITESSLTTADCSSESRDYTSILERFTQCETNDIIERIHVSEILDQSALTDNERKVFLQAMDDPFHGWHSAFARTLISETTNQNVSRQYVAQLLQQAKKKIAATMERLNVA
jgi:RNA polymerase sigma factor (sigma-70 family)